MTTLTQSHNFTTASQRSLRSCLGWLRSVVDGMRRAHRRRAMLRALDALDERTLHDIGVHRNELDSVVAELLGAAPATRRRVMQLRSGRAVT
jgi:uncharacterized protein YjiS (DUF1127 family)